MTSHLSPRGIGALCILGGASVEYGYFAIPLIVAGEPGFQHRFEIEGKIQVAVQALTELPQQVMIFVVKPYGKDFVPSDYDLCSDAMVYLTEHVEKLRDPSVREGTYTAYGRHTPYVRELQRALFRLIDLASTAGYRTTHAVTEAKELIRCARLECGLGGACDGHGGKQYPCPLKIGAPR